MNILTFRAQIKAFIIIIPPKLLDRSENEFDKNISINKCEYLVVHSSVFNRLSIDVDQCCGEHGHDDVVSRQLFLLSSHIELKRVGWNIRKKTRFIEVAKTKEGETYPGDALQDRGRERRWRRPLLVASASFHSRSRREKRESTNWRGGGGEWEWSERASSSVEGGGK